MPYTSCTASLKGPIVQIQQMGGNSLLHHMRKLQVSNGRNSYMKIQPSTSIITTIEISRDLHLFTDPEPLKQNADRQRSPIFAAGR